MNHFITSAALNFFITFGAAVFLLFSGSPIKRYFGYFWFCVSFWVFLVGFQFQILRWMDPKTWGFVLHIGCISVPLVFYHFTLKYKSLDLSPFYKRIFFAGCGLFFVFLILIVFTDVFTGEIVYREFYAYPKPSFLYPLYIAYFQFYGILSTMLILRSKNGLEPYKKKYLYSFLMLHVLAYAGAMDNYLIMYDVQIFPLYPFGLYLLVPYVLFGSYSLIRILE